MTINIVLFLCLCFFMGSLLGLIRTNAASNAFKLLLQIVESLPTYEERSAAIKLFSTDYAYGWRVQINPFTWGPKAFHPELVEFLESKGVEVK